MSSDRPVAASRAAHPSGGCRNKLRNFRPVALRIHRILTPGNVHLSTRNLTSAELLDVLEQNDFLAAASSLMSFALPEREAVWWACMCVRHVGANTLPAEQQRALAAAEGWVRKPDANTRAQALAAFKAAKPVTAVAMAAKAAHAAQLANEASLSANRRIEVAIRRAAGDDGKERTRARLLRFLASGREIAAGGSGRLAPERTTGLERIA